MYLVGYDEYAWKRPRIMASEDVEPAEPNPPATITALYATYSDLKKRNDKAHAPQRLQFVRAVTHIHNDLADRALFRLVGQPNRT
jgi:hypothetical protein